MRTSIIVQNLKCGGCAKTIVSKIAEVESVTDLAVEVDTATISFLYENINDALEVKKRMKAMGYPEKGTGTSIDNAKSYVSCMIGRIQS